MTLVERFKIYLNKENFYYSTGQVDPYEFHKTLYKLSSVFRVLDNEPIQKWTILIPTVVCIFGAIAASLTCLAMIQAMTIFDVPLMTEAGTYFIVMVYKLMIISCTLTDKAYYHKFLQAMREDFVYICTKGSKYRERYFQNHLWTWKASILSSIFIAFVGSGMMVCANIALIYFLIFPTVSGLRPLPFPFWAFGFDFWKSPNYEITFIFSNVCVVTHTSTYIFMMQTQIVWIRQIMSKADVIIWSIEDLLVDVQPNCNKQLKQYYEQILKARLREIIKMHHSMYKLFDDYAGVYRKLLMYEQKLCAPLVCLCAFCVAEKLDAGEIPGITALLCSAVIIVVYIPSYMCTVLGEKVQSIGEVCCKVPFWDAPGKVIRPYFILIMQRSLRPLPIQAQGFETVSLQTFADKMMLAYNGFNMLRQRPGRSQ